MAGMNAISASIVLTDHHEFNGLLMLIPGSHEKFVPRTGETPEDSHGYSLKSRKRGRLSAGVGYIPRRQAQEASGRAPSCLAAFSWLWFCYACNKA
ncbi:hypothetical protein [Kushneria phyllosphaerae]|uniref:Ectoine dioxygenase n=1 Tax=Kushneria phyllosphaerae TaxID=2100822 RepID=A0A2R8CJA1_9GAMM|nr:Ectoine dioxygenase [Kushneria phyllosphaerae]